MNIIFSHGETLEHFPENEWVIDKIMCSSEGLIFF